MPKRINGATDDLHPVLVIGGIAAAYFFLIKPLSTLFGRTDEQKQAILQEQLLAPAENPFNMNYQPFVDWFNANPWTDVNGNQMSLQQVMQSVKAGYDAGTLTKNEKDYNIANWAETIYNALNVWYSPVDSNAILLVFEQVPDKTAVSAIAAYFQYNFNTDLFKRLNGSLFMDGVSGDVFEQIINIVNGLP